MSTTPPPFDYYELRTMNLLAAYQDESLMSRLNMADIAALQDRIINRLQLKERHDAEDL